MRLYDTALATTPRLYLEVGDRVEAYHPLRPDVVLWYGTVTASTRYARKFVVAKDNGPPRHFSARGSIVDPGGASPIRIRRARC